MNKEIIGGVVGTSVSAVGTGMQTNEVLQTISLILTIAGTLVTIIMALMNWYNNAKKDGKIDKEEIKDVVDIVVKGGEEIKEKIDKKDKE